MSKPDTPWIPRIRKGKKLTVYNGAEIGLWSGVVNAAVPIFNQIILKAMEYELTTDDSADVVVKIAGGGDGEPALGKTATHGVARRYIGSRGVEKAEVFLPSEPWQKHKKYAADDPDARDGACCRVGKTRERRRIYDPSKCGRGKDHCREGWQGNAAILFFE